MENKYDIVVIGSGLGGLACAYILSKFDYKVCVLEKHFQLGGNLQTFKRKSCQFDTGMHYVGSLGKGEVLHKFFNYLDLLSKVDMQKLDENGFDVINIEGREYNYAMGYDKFTASLIRDFPDEEEAINAYANKIKELGEGSPLYNLREVDSLDLMNMDAYGANTADFIASLTKNETLRNVLAGLNPLSAGSEKNTPLYVHALINHFFITSAWRLTGGGSQIAEGLSESIKQMGGVVLANHEVTKFNFEGKLISSVETKNGDIFHAENFISNMHPSLTMDLIPEGKIRKSYKSRLNNLENTISSFSMYVVLKKHKIPFLNRNYYHYKSNQVWGVDNYSNEPWPQGIMYYYTEDKKNPGFAESISIVTYMNYSEVKQWEDSKIEKRGDEYRKFKKEKEEAIMLFLQKSIANISSSVDSVFSATPLTFRDYTGTKNGSMYGIVRDCNNPVASYIPARTKISNLLLTGQNINLHGITGVLSGSILTCSAFVPINDIIRDINTAYK